MEKKEKKKVDKETRDGVLVAFAYVFLILFFGWTAIYFVVPAAGPGLAQVSTDINKAVPEWLQNVMVAGAWVCGGFLLWMRYRERR